MQEDEGAERGRERDDDPGQHVVAEEDASQDRDEAGVERAERRACLVVAVLRDADEEHAVPTGPDIRRVAEVVDQR